METQKLKDIIEDVLSEDKRIDGFYLEHTDQGKNKLHVAISSKKFTRINLINFLEEFGVFTRDVEIIICSNVDAIIDVYNRCKPVIVEQIKLIEEPKVVTTKKTKKKKE